MVYLCTNQAELVEDNYKIITPEEALDLLKDLKIIGVDTETTGLDCHTDTLLSIQFGNKDFQIVVDCTTVSIQLFKPILEDPSRTLLFWNSKFDLKWLFQNSIVPYKVYDGFLAEKLLWLGYPAGYHNMSLKAAAWKYCNIAMSKSEREEIVRKKRLTTSSILYAAKDVEFLETIINEQYKQLQAKELTTAIIYENKFALPLSYMEWCGIKIDVDKWKSKIAQDEALRVQAKEALDNWLIANYPDSPYIYVDNQGDLWNGFNFEKRCSLNWDSPAQVIAILEQEKLNLVVKDKKTGGTKKSCDAKVLKPQSDKSPLVPLYLKYKKMTKLTSTYGQNFLDQINSSTGRLYTQFQQLGADTTRITSGGKDRAAKIEYINLLNLPSDSFTRSCFIAENGNRWISLDYAGQEAALLASIANDPLMLKELNEGDKDIHSLVASLVFEDDLKGVPLKDVKRVSEESAHNGGINYRKVAKGYEFLVAYGGNADTIKANYGKSDEEANQIYNRYMKGLTGVQKYQSECRKAVMRDGYILINPKTGHKVFMWEFDTLLETRAKFSPEFWDYHREMKKTNPSSAIVQEVRDYFKLKAEYEKASINYRIQGTGSMCLRVSLINFFEELRKRNWLFKVLINVCPYDEINCEAPSEIANEVTKLLYSCMTKAGDFFCTRCKLDADISYDENGELPTYWIH